MGFEVDLKDFIKNLNFIKHGQELKFGDESLKVLDLPGHTPGGTGLYSSKEKMVFVGDTLFQSSIGRTDFPKSNFKSLMKGIMEHLMALPDDTLVLPGHGPTTTIGKERSSNMFIQTEIIKAQRKL
ncbi:MBL fold metallo-hydrolase [Histomonas meleagridis]|uniref:MBL fold metallo-hydrolase n=1 Tax=Histomonas meleagridis TaxID=135588 RepID=UPI00355997F8|nr:MBL fold metallo-hydrolase [Histomonas meleagridis]KAH0799990.1 MBL fold metallo-hydrolase [Histomonas meleagridis]